MTIETIEAVESVAVNHAETVTAAIVKMRSDDGQAETTAVNFVRATLAALLAGAMTIEGVAARVIEGYKIVTPKDKASKATISGVKNGMTARGASAQFLAKRLEVADFAYRNHNAAPDVVTAFLAGDTSCKSVAALQRMIAAAVEKAAADEMAANPPADDDAPAPVEAAPVEAAPVEAAPVIVSIADMFAALAERIASATNADDDMAIANGVLLLDAAVSARVKRAKVAKAA